MTIGSFCRLENINKLQRLPSGHPSRPLSDADNVSLYGTDITAEPFLNWLVVAWSPRNLPQTQSNDVCLTLFATMLCSTHDFSKFSIDGSRIACNLVTDAYLLLQLRIVVLPDLVIDRASIPQYDNDCRAKKIRTLCNLMKDIILRLFFLINMD